MSSLLLLCLKKSPCPSYQVHQSLKSSKWLSKLPSRTSSTLHGRVSQPFRTAHSGAHMKWTCRNWTHKSPFSLLQRRNYISVHRKVRTLPKHSRAGTGLLHVARQSGTVSKPATEVVKKEIKRSDVVRLFALAKPEKMQILVAIGLLAISSTVTMAVPFAVGRIINMISDSDHRDFRNKLGSFSLLLLGVFLVGAAANGSRYYLMQTSANRIIKRMREQLFGSIIRQEMSFFDKTKTGELINRLSTDTALVGQTITMNISDGLRSTAMAGASVSMMFYVCPKLAAIALSIVPPIAAASIIYGRYVKKLTRQVQDSLAESTQVAEERLANLRTVRAFAKENLECNRYGTHVDHVLKLSYKEAVASGLFWASTGLSGNLVILSVFYYGGIMMSEASLTVGDLTAFLLYAAYTGMSMGGLSGFYSNSMKGLGACSRIWELSDRMPAIPLKGGIIPSAEIQGDIEFRNIHFCYPTREDVTILQGLNLRVPAGRVLAIAGSSGSGKSTLASLLLRYYDPQQGGVYLDGQNICEMDPTWLRSNMGVVSQEPVLFSSSIYENIAYGAHDPSQVSSADIEQAARMANAHGFITSFPNGYDTVVGERGVLLSGGQKQRIAIARAIIKNPKILLLDEATSALDAESEYLVQEAMDRVMEGRTVITIAHRLSTIQKAHTIAVLDKGTIAESGSYLQLLNNSEGIFSTLVQRQMASNNSQ